MQLADSQPRTAPLDNLRPVPDDVLVIDAVVHAFNLSRENIASRYGEALWAQGYGLHCMLNPPHAHAPQAAYLADQPIEKLAEAIFLESRVDIAVTHNLRLDGWFRDGYCSEAKTLEAVSRWPTRFFGYVGLDPTLEIEAIKDDLRRQQADMPGAIGVKLYPHNINPYRRRRLDDDGLIEVFQLALELGFRTIAVHKALPNGPVPLDPYRVDDVDIAADSLPGLNFEIIHSGMAFLEETALAMMRFPNVYANLETTTALLWRAPLWFEDIMAKLMFFGGPDRILFATGASLVHPAHVVELFWNFRFSEATLEKYGLPQIGQDALQAMLGTNYARMAGLDAAALKAGIADDDFARRKAASGQLAPWSSWAEAA